jgi:hypothetical protein
MSAAARVTSTRCAHKQAQLAVYAKSSKVRIRIVVADYLSRIECLVDFATPYYCELASVVYLNAGYIYST